MRILLISENVTIQKLFKLSAEKRGDEVEVGSKDFLPEGEFDLVFIDKDILDDELLQNLKNIYPNAKFILILSKNDEKIPGFDYYLTKPFLPTDLIALIEKTHTSETTEEAMEMDEFDEDLDIENLNDLDFEDDGEEIGDIEDIFVDDDDLDVETSDEDLEEDFELNADDLLKEDEMMEKDESENLEIEDILEEKPEENIEVEDILEEKALEDEIETKEEVDEDIISNEEMLESDEEILENEDVTENIEDIINEAEENEEMNEAVENIEENIEETQEAEDISDLLENEEIENLKESDEDLEPEFLETEEELQEEQAEILENEKNIEENIQNTEDELSELENLDEKELAEALGENVEDLEEAPIQTSDLIQENQEEQSHKTESDNEPSIEEKTLGNILNINWEELKKAKAKVTITIDFGG